MRTKLSDGYTWDIIEGCNKISTGCLNCYVEQNLGDAFHIVKLFPERLQEPYTWEKEARIFMSDKADIFHPKVPLSFIQQILEVIKDNPTRTFCLLTKRPERLDIDEIVLPENTWFGVSVENQDFLYRTNYFNHPNVQSRVKYISAQPLLGSLDLSTINFDWIMVGEEYGPNYRPMNLDWVRQIRDHVAARNIPMSFQQCVTDNELVVFPRLDGKTIVKLPKR